mgnify:CR=1 FL=1
MENPNKKYKTIGKVSEQLDIKKHVIRYWCSKFDGLYIRFGSKKQRYFNKDHIKKLQDLKSTLYKNGKHHNYSLDLAEKIIKNNKIKYKKKSEYLSSKKISVDIKKLMIVRDSLSKLL